MGFNSGFKVLIRCWAKFRQGRRPISCDTSASFSVYPRSHLRLLRNSTHALWRTHSHKSLYTHNTLGSHFTTWSRESFLPLSCLPQRTRIPSDTPQADSELSPVWSPLNITSFTITSCNGATPNDSPCCDKHCFIFQDPAFRSRFSIKLTVTTLKISTPCIPAVNQFYSFQLNAYNIWNTYLYIYHQISISPPTAPSNQFELFHDSDR